MPPKISSLFCATTIVCFLLLVFSILTGHQQIVAPAPYHFPDFLQPGSPMPKVDVVCFPYYYYYPSLTETCQIGNYVFSFDKTEEIIDEVSIVPLARPLGDYILAWGTPTGMSVDSVFTYIYWGDVRVWVLSNRLSPYAVVYTISEAITPGGIGLWRGFIQPVSPTP